MSDDSVWTHRSELPDEWPVPTAAWVSGPVRRDLSDPSCLRADALLSITSDQETWFMWTPGSMEQTFKGITANGRTYRPAEPIHVEDGSDVRVEGIDGRVTYTVTTPDGDVRRYYLHPH